MDTFSIFLNDIAFFFGDAWNWLWSLTPHQVLRVFWATIFLELPRYSAANFYVLILYLRGNFDRTQTGLAPFEAPLVTIIVPSHNEGAVIAATVASLAEQDYPNIEIVIVDDGSTDSTVEQFAAIRRRPGVNAFRLPQRQGKSAACNFGLSVSKGEYVVFMDADSTLGRDVVSTLISYFDDPTIGAVSGDLEVRNRYASLLTRLQAFEYLISISLGRRFKAKMGILSIVPGAIGAFRRDLLIRVGGMEPGPGNDSDLTIKTRKLDMRIAFAGNAACLTTVPVGLAQLCRQRMRWDRNIVSTYGRKHGNICNPKYANFNLSNFLSFAEMFFFVAFLPLAWIAYAFDIVFVYPYEYIFIFLGIAIIQLGLSYSHVLIGALVTGRKFDLADLFIAMPLYGFYRLLLKLVRVAAIGQELLLRSSYRDPFAPEKVRKKMKVY